MSTLFVSGVFSNGSTDLTLSTGNTAAPPIVVQAITGTVSMGNTSLDDYALTVSAGSVVTIQAENILGSAINANTDSGVSIAARSNTGAGVTGTSTTSNGVIGTSNTGRGVTGISNTAVGIFAKSTTGQPFIAANNTVNTFIVEANGAVDVIGNILYVGTPTLAANGYTFLPNGLKINWGVVAANSSTGGNATFSSSFTTVYGVMTSGANSLGNTSWVNAVNTTVAQVRSTNAAAGGGSVYYIAYGV